MKAARIFVLTIATLLLLVGLTACGGSQESSAPASNGGEAAQTSESNAGNSSSAQSGEGSDYPNKPITLIVAYAAGGGTDVGARILVPYLEKELGVPVNVVNKPGGGGWIGWNELANAEPDGYTIGYINTPNFMTGYLDPQYKREHNLESFIPIANHVTDPGVIAIRNDEKRFSNIQELIEYAKQNELTTTSTGVGSDDHLAALKLNDKFGTKLKPVHNGGAAESRTAVLGGHVDLLFANAGEVFQMHKDGEVKIIAVMAEERSPFLPDVPTMKESGFDVVSGSARGIAAPKGVDPEKIEILRAALEKGIKNEEQGKKMAGMGLQVDYKEGEEYKNMLVQDEKGVIELRHLLGC
ncbi:tripartite tricarboxylate transporter substrate binding protein [Bacillaceae bacterium]